MGRRSGSKSINYNIKTKADYDNLYRTLIYGHLYKDGNYYDGLSRTTAERVISCMKLYHAKHSDQVARPPGSWKYTSANVNLKAPRFERLDSELDDPVRCNYKTFLDKCEPKEDERVKHKRNNLLITTTIKEITCASDYELKTPGCPQRPLDIYDIPSNMSGNPDLILFWAYGITSKSSFNAWIKMMETDPDKHSSKTKHMKQSMEELYERSGFLLDNF